MMGDSGDKDTKRFHSVILDEEACKGCTVCVTTCPVEAIRVRDGKARILAERCIDCGECIRRCPNHAKKARADALTELSDSGEFARFDWKIALPAPSLYGQFSERYSVEAIHAALLEIGFDAVYPVSRATPAIADTARELLDRSRHPDLPRPLISSSCPTIVKVIQIRFPTLLAHIAPIIAPMELAGRLARREAQRDHPEKTRVGCFFISPCAGKITEAKAPIGGESSAIDGVFSMKDIHLPLLAALGKVKREPDATPATPDESTGVPRIPSIAREIAWGRAGGEAEATVGADEATAGEGTIHWLAVDGMDQCARILEAVEDGKLKNIDLLELMACVGGCVGGPLAVENVSLARHSLKNREHELKGTSSRADAVGEDAETGGETCLRAMPFPARPALLLDGDYQKAMAMMEEMEAISESLPGLDCGCCGAPNCHALAEDIVRGNASKTDCVIILKEQYRELLEKGAGEEP
jgi:iron only hydrogenase large subunit-like protein